MFFYHTHFHETYQSDILFPLSNIFENRSLVALARNPLNMLVIVLRDIQEYGVICTFVKDGLQ